MPTEEEDLATLIVNLKTRRKKEDLLKIAESCKRLRELYGSYTKVARKVGLNSGEMIREFEALLKLPKDVKRLIRTGKLQSVVAGYWISKMKRSEQDKVKLALILVKQKLTAHDVRDIVSFANGVPDEPIEECVKKVLESKMVEKQYLFSMKLEDAALQILRQNAKMLGTTPESLAKRIIQEIAEPKNIVLFEIRNNLIIIRVREEGFRALNKTAKDLKVGFEDLAEILVKTRLQKSD
jgi:hypothetical protein